MCLRSAGLRPEHITGGPILTSTLWLCLHLALPLARADADDVVRLLRAERVAEALDEARASVTRDEADVESHELLIDILMNLGMGWDAQEAYRVRVQARPDDPMAWYLFGRAAVTAKEATEAYTRAVELDPKLGRAWMGLASVDRALGQAERAKTRYEKALALDPTLSEAWAGLGALHIAAGRHDLAVQVCERAIAAIPSDPEAYLAIASLRPERALDVLQQGAKASPEEPRVWEALAAEQIKAGQLKDAERALETALRLNPASSQAAFDLAVVHEIQAGHLDVAGQAALARARLLGRDSPIAARVELDALVERYPACHLVFLARGHTRSEQGDLTGAETDLRRAIALAPNSPDVQGALGMLLLSQGQAREGMVLLDSAHAQRPHDASLGVAAGMAHVAVEGPKAGLQVLATVSAMHPTDARPVMAMVSVLTQQGNAEGAFQVLANAIARFADPSLLLAYAAAAKDIGKDAEALAALDRLYRMTGEERYARMADALRAELRR
ncbi:MAG: tetratricopeptide repeat protein [Alphaproteobacteria bacterium]|nr:tetratricopeptide repeat protein [Alphaproteobacteria bacterium]